jgi:hypothetical protein
MGPVVWEHRVKRCVHYTTRVVSSNYHGNHIREHAGSDQEFRTRSCIPTILKFTSQVNCRVNCNDICRTHCVEYDRKLVNKLVERDQKIVWSPVQKRTL